MSVLYEPIYLWVHQHLTQGKLPLICDLVMHGAPIAAYSMAGVLSPVLWLFHWITSYTFLFNLLFLVPQLLYLLGAYFLGRELKLSRSASLLLALLWAFNGHQMAQLDHLNVSWSHAFFPWAFLALLRYMETRSFFLLLLGALFLGLNLISGHPQVFFMECLFFLFWALFSPTYSLKERSTATAVLGSAALIVASPLILFTAECLKGDFQPQWGNIDRFYHSWTPLNLLTLIYPWFFGKTQYDRADGDYWWQYQFVEMQVAFSIVGLFFILYYFTRKDLSKRWIVLTFLLALAMALGKFCFLYSLIQSLPFFSYFRDPARYWFLATWVLGIAAGKGWDLWFNEEADGRKLAFGLTATVIAIPLLGLTLVVLARPLLITVASFFIRHFLLGDATHPQPLSYYLDHVPQKLDLLAYNLSPIHFRVLLPILFSIGLSAVVMARSRYKPGLLKMILLFLVLADLYAFRMPLGNSFYKTADITAPQVPAPENRSLTLLYLTPSPLPNQYGEMAYPNMNIAFNRPNLVFDANPTPRRYADIWAKLGWFSWVYKDRDPMGFSKNAPLLQELGVDQIVSDVPLDLPSTFRIVRNTYPFVYRLPSVLPKAFIGRIHEKTMAINPRERQPNIQEWDETHLSLSVIGENKAYDLDHLILQKSFLPGWKGFINGKRTTIERDFDVFISLPLAGGTDHVDLKFDPTGLRLGFFLFLAFFAVFSFFGVRRILP